MKQGDFSKLAKAYVNRPGYSRRVIRMLGTHVGSSQPGFVVADIGAGTGKLTEILLEEGFRGHAVEPNAEMRQEGFSALGHLDAFQWRAGTAEATTLPDSSVNWVLMASAFHWTDEVKALAEFHRILVPGGYFTALWNPRYIEHSPLEQEIEKLIREIVPELQRVSSGSRECTSRLDETLQASGRFEDLVFIEAQHEVVMEHDRYLGVWRSVNDIQSQAGPERFQKIMAGIEYLVRDMDRVVVPYKTRSWTVQRAGS